MIARSSRRGTNAEPPQDQYFKGPLHQHAAQHCEDDAKWWPMLRGYYQKYKYQNIMTEDIVQYFNQQTGMDLTPSSTSICGHRDSDAGLKFDDAAGTVNTAGLPTRRRCDAGAGRLERALGDDPPHDGVADDEDSADQGPV
jgi:hypothetical protein